MGGGGRCCAVVAEDMMMFLAGCGVVDVLPSTFLSCRFFLFLCAVQSICEILNQN